MGSGINSLSDILGYLGENVKAAIENELFQGYLSRTTATQVTLAADGGNFVAVNGSLVDISAGLTRLSTDNLIDATGADALAAMGASTLYYAYISNSSATFSPSSIRFSTTAPTAYRGNRYLAATGNGANWRFFGYARTNASSQFQQDNTFIGIVNWYNQRIIRAGTAPGYVDNNANTTYTRTAGANWAAANGGTGSRITVISDGRHAVQAGAHENFTTGATAGCAGFLGIGFDSTTDTTIEAAANTVSAVAQVFNLSGQEARVLSEGVHTVDLLVRATNATITISADDARVGATADPAQTYLEVVMLG